MKYLSNFLDSRAAPLLCDPMQKTSDLCVLGVPQGHCQQSWPDVACSWSHDFPGAGNIQQSVCCLSSLGAQVVRCSQTVLLWHRSSLGPAKILLKRKGVWGVGNDTCVLLTTDQVLTDLFVFVCFCQALTVQPSLTSNLRSPCLSHSSV